MYVILAVESVWVLCFIIGTLHLDCCVVQIMLSAAHVSDCGQCLQWFDRLDVNGHGDFALANGPHVQVMDVNDIVATSVCNVLSELLD